MHRIFIYTAFIALLYACKSKPAPAETDETNTNGNTVMLDSLQKKNAGLTYDTIRHMPMHNVIRASGVVDVPPQNLISISFPLGGYLKSTTLLPGSPVNKGEVIGIMEDQSFVQLQQDYLTARSNMEYLSADMQRQKTLSEADAISKKKYQQILNEYKNAEISLKSLGEKLRIININPAKLSVGNISSTVPLYSPINGYVTKVNVNIGKYVMPTDVLFELVNPEDIHASVTVFEKDLPAFSKGLHGTVSLADKPDKTYDIEVILVTKNVNDNRSGLIHCHFENAGHDLLPGMFLNATFDMDNEMAVAVPEEAVVRYMGKEYVFATNDEKQFTLIPVTTGRRENKFVQLTGDGQALQNQKLVIKGAYAVLGQMKNKGTEE